MMPRSVRLLRRQAQRSKTGGTQQPPSLRSGEGAGGVFAADAAPVGPAARMTAPRKSR